MELQGQRVDPQRALGWIQRLARLDTTVFDEVRTDATATLTAIAVVVIASLLAGLGSWLWVLVNLRSSDSGQFFLDTVILGSLFHIMLWFAWVFISYIVLTQIFRAKADSTQMVRTMGLGVVPMAFSLLMFIPVVDWTVGLVSVVATVLLMNYAIQSTTTATPPQVNIANLAGFAVLVLVLSLLASSSHDRAPGLYAFDSWKDIVIDIRTAIAGFGADFFRP
jgi:hypothetical protein